MIEVTFPPIFTVSPLLSNQTKVYPGPEEPGVKVNSIPPWPFPAQVVGVLDLSVIIGAPASETLTFST